MNCPKCGAANNADARFCGSCGYDLSTQTQQTNQTEEVLDVVEQQPTIVEQPVASQEPTIQPVVNNQPTQPMVGQPFQPTPNVQNTNPGVQQPPKKKGKAGIIIGAIAAVLVIIAAIIAIISFATPSEEKEAKKKIDAMFNPDNLIKVKSGDKYGYIDTEGKFVINAIYEEASDFIGDFAVVRAEVEVDGLKKVVYQIIDEKGKVKKQAAEGIEYVADVGLWIIDDQLYSSSMKKISPENVKVEYEDEGYFIWIDPTNQTGGIMNEKGKQTYTYKFQSGENYISIDPSENDESLKETYCRVNIENEKYAIVNCDTGVVVHDFSEYYVSTEDDNIFELSNHDTWEFIEIMYIQGDKKVYTSNSSRVSLYYYTGYVSITDRNKSYSEGRYTYLHTDTLEIKDEKPSSSSSSSTTDEEKLDEWEKYTNNIKFSCTGGYGLMNNDAITLPCEWDDLEYLEINLSKQIKNPVYRKL